MNAKERQAAIGRERSKAIARIRGFMLRATDSERADGAGWYPTALEIAEGFAEHYGFGTRAVVGALAAISPGLKWERNLICGRAILQWARDGFPKAGEPIVETYTYGNVRKARAILEGSDPDTILSGPKVVPFFRTILSPETERTAVLDGHIANALRGDVAGLRDVKGISALERSAWQEAFAFVSDESGIPVSALQATVWLVHKREKDNRLPF